MGIRRDGGWRVVALRWLAYGPAALVCGLLVTVSLGLVKPRWDERLLRRALDAYFGVDRAGGGR